MSGELLVLELYAKLPKMDTPESRETIEGVQQFLEASKLDYGKVVTDKNVTFYLRKESA